jgi:alpha-mannosidase II
LSAFDSIRMSDVYDEIPFDNPDGGAWKQGWPITYDKKEAMDQKNKMKVFVIPHSHCDPGKVI